MSNNLTPCLSDSTQSTLVSSPIKLKPVKSLLSGKISDFLLSWCRLYNSIHLRKNLKSLIFPGEFLHFTAMSFDINPVILLMWSLVPSMVCKFYPKLFLSQYNMLLVINMRFVIPFLQCYQILQHKFKFEIFQKPPRRCSVKKRLKNFSKFTGKHLCQSLFFNKVAGLRSSTLLKKRLWHRCFHKNFEKFLKTPFFTEHLRTTASNFGYLSSTRDLVSDFYKKVLKKKYFSKYQM